MKVPFLLILTLITSLLFGEVCGDKRDSDSQFLTPIGISTIQGATGVTLTGACAAAANAAMASLCMTTTQNVLINICDPEKGIKETFRAKTLKNMGKAALCAGIANAVTNALDISPDALKADMVDPNMAESIAIHAPEGVTRGIVNATVSATFDKDYKGDSLLEGVAADAVGAGVANSIGQNYNLGKMDFVAHKISHGLLGAGIGAALGGKDGALTGAIAAISAEIASEILSPEKPNLEAIRQKEKELGRNITEAEFLETYKPIYDAYTQEAQNAAKFGKIIGTSLGALTRGNLEISSLTASNAVDNNFAHLAIFGVAAVGTAYSLYQVYKAYEGGGPIAALQTLGIEVGMVVVGGAFIKGAVAGGKVAFRLIGSTQLYHTAGEALSVAYAKTPGLKYCVEGIHQKLVSAFQKFESSSVGQTLGEWDAKLARFVGGAPAAVYKFKQK